MTEGTIRAVAFDAYGTLFDVHSVSDTADRLFPGKGSALSVTWREKQIQYSFLRTTSKRYKPFTDVTRDALRYAAKSHGLKLADADEKELMDQYLRLQAFPENLDALKELKSIGVPLAILSNGEQHAVQRLVDHAGMSGIFDHILSADTVKRFKTASEVYDLGPQAFKCSANEILFVSSNGWDACGATYYGYRTFWINRKDAPHEELDVEPVHMGKNLDDVAAVVREANEKFVE